ncbi:MAG TPA: SRPBCC domain-containing protein [Croceibacterium sp.]|nr:SRPBCC domain-containing protein [Croceibacterium sp.]
MAAIHDTFTLQRRYPHARELVFAALSDPALKARWYASPSTELELCESDFRIGGADRQRSVLGQGTPFPGAALENEGRFEDIADGERIVVSTSMTFGGRRISSALLTFELADAEGGCTLTFTHQAVFYEGADGPEMRREGWEKLLDALARSLAS